MSTSFIRFLDELEHYKSFLFLKSEKIEDSPLKNHADDQPSKEFKKSNRYFIFAAIIWHRNVLRIKFMRCPKKIFSYSHGFVLVKSNGT